MTLDPVTVLNQLSTAAPMRLDALPREHGIYALHDHAGSIRYIGITKADTYGFHGRINSRHVSGSEGRSHKFSHAYNTGRMWRAKRDRSPDASVAKQLRIAFVRRHYRATFVVVPSEIWRDLPALEVAVQSIAPPGMLDWGGKRVFDPLPEPTELLNALLNDLRFSPDNRAAIDRQAALHASSIHRPIVLGRSAGI